MIDSINLSFLLIFIPTFFIVSITPGMCMLLALSMGIGIGLKKTMYMMAGELVGVFIMSTLSATGIATIMLKYPYIFTIFKYIGGSYLIYLGVLLWLSKGKMSFKMKTYNNQISNKDLAIQGFITAIANPKGWAFFISLLPSFIDTSLDLVPQLSILITLILIIEFICLVIYASGGHILNRLLQDKSNVKMLDKITGSLMIGIGGWLALL
jgi:threonine/homoserine/homoserine lactone efflux protein